MDTIKNHHSAIPYVLPVDDRLYSVVETVADDQRGSVRIRLRLGRGKYINITTADLIFIF